MQPHVPPFQLDEIEFPPLVLAPGPESFVVHEEPLYLPSGEGPHTYVRIEKIGLTTREAVSLLCEAVGASPRDVGYAGQKDKHARTTQWISLPPGVDALSAGQQISDELRLLEVSRHTNKLRVGHLVGNKFELTFDVSGDLQASVDAVGAALGRLSETGMRNYYGPQRFGRGGRNVASGLAWARGEFRLRGKSARYKSDLFASSLQSDVFNRYLTARAAREERLLEGEIVRLAGSKSVFVVESVADELERLHSGDLVPTGPMFGPKMVRAAGVAAALERAAEDELGLDEEAQAVVARRARGTRRDLYVPIGEARAEVASPGRVVVCFSLPSGSYATQLARELTRLPWKQPLRPTHE